jgi:tight adherence protein B
MKQTITALAVSLLTAYLFYDRIWGMIFVIPVFVLLLRYLRHEEERNRQAKAAGQFQGVLYTMMSSLRTGYSVENAWKDAYSQLVKQDGAKCELAQIMQPGIRQLEMNQPFETVLQDFAKRFPIEEAQDFAEIITVARKMGGNMVQISANAATRLTQSMEIEQEIQTLLAARKYEWKIMSVIPLAMIGYLRIGSKGYLDMLYGNLFGVLFMSGCLALYLAALAWTVRLMDIRL